LFEVSPLCNYNIVESFTELSRMALRRNGMERLWRSNKVLTLQELCCRTIVARTTVYGIEQLPLPGAMKSHLKSYSMTSYKSRLRQGLSHQQEKNIKKTKIIHPCDSPTLNCRKSCVVSWCANSYKCFFVYFLIIIFFRFFCILVSHRILFFELHPNKLLQKLGLVETNISW